MPQPETPTARATAEPLLERFTVQHCPARKHADWAVDSENSHACPWCEIEILRASWRRVHEALIIGQRADAVMNLMDGYERSYVPTAASRPCNCGHDRAQHDNGQCRVCPGDSENTWQHPYTAAVSAPGGE
jgi:hypothetical protein